MKRIAGQAPECLSVCRIPGLIPRPLTVWVFVWARNWADIVFSSFYNGVSPAYPDVMSTVTKIQFNYLQQKRNVLQKKWDLHKSSQAVKKGAALFKMASVKKAVGSKLAAKNLLWW